MMKDLRNLILEKLSLGEVIKKSTTNRGHLRDLSNIELGYGTAMPFQANSLRDKKKNGKMVKIAYNDKRNPRNPKLIYNRNTKIYDLCDRFLCAIYLEWDEAIEELRNVIIHSSYFYPPSVKNQIDIENQIDRYIYKLYSDDAIIYTSEDYTLTGINDKESLENYFDKYNIKY